MFVRMFVGHEYGYDCHVDNKIVRHLLNFITTTLMPDICTCLLAAIIFAWDLEK